MYHYSQNTGIEVSGEYDRIPVMIDNDVLEFCTVKVNADLKLDFDHSGWYAVTHGSYEIIAEHAVDDDAEIVLPLVLRPHQIGANSWNEIQKDLREKAAELYAKGDGHANPENDPDA